MYKRSRYPQEILSRNEVESLMNACSGGSTGIRNRALIGVLYRSGMRISEALSLTDADLDQENQRIWIRPHKGMAYWAYMDAFDILEPWLKRRQKLGLRGPIFCTLLGRPILDNYVRTLLPRLAKNAGIKRRVHAHAFRHTYASELSDEGVPITEISEALGHHSLATTSVYIGKLQGAQRGPKRLHRERWTLNE